MKSIHSIYKAVRSNENDNSGITENATAITSRGQASSASALSTQVNSQGGVLVGSSTMRVINVASCPTAIPVAGTAYFDTTLKCLLISDATSMFTAEGSLAVT